MLLLIKIRIFSSTRTAVKAAPPWAPLMFHLPFPPSPPRTWEPLGLTKVGGLADKKNPPRRKEKKKTLYLVKGVANLGSHD